MRTAVTRLPARTNDGRTRCHLRPVRPRPRPRRRLRRRRCSRDGCHLDRVRSCPRRSRRCRSPVPDRTGPSSGGDTTDRADARSSVCRRTRGAHHRRSWDLRRQPTCSLRFTMTVMASFATGRRSVSRPRQARVSAAVTARSRPTRSRCPAQSRRTAAPAANGVTVMLVELPASRKARPTRVDSASNVLVLPMRTFPATFVSSRAVQEATVTTTSRKALASRRLPVTAKSPPCAQRGRPPARPRRRICVRPRFHPEEG